jgi:GH43 family beta-xylosidase
MYFKKPLLVYSLLLLCTVAVHSQDSLQTFTNPLLPTGADPFSFYKDGYYYYTHTTGNRIVIWKTKNLATLKTAEQKTIFTPSPGTAYSKEIWAPEIHFINGKWYAYFAADDGNNNNHRMYVLENESTDPMQGHWVFKGKVADPSDKWAIDGDVFIHKKKLYMIWSGWEGDHNGQQNIYIAKMKNPWTIEGDRVRISSSDFDWEKHGDLHDSINPPHVNVNEGPQLLQNGKRIFIIYSASGCWTDYYALGLLSFSGKKHLLDASKWKKAPQPVFKQSQQNGVYAPGHNSFFKSPDGKEDWILYHANSLPGQGCGRHRSPRAQKFKWNKDGTPDFGEPLMENTPVPIPSEKNN